MSDLQSALSGKKNLYGANLLGAHLPKSDLSGANLSRAYLSGANLFRANLCGANLCRANLSKARLARVDLCTANLSEADLSGAYLSGAYLSRANLSGADLFRANLSGANLLEANLSGADLYGMRLDGAVRLNWQSHDLVAEVLRQAAGKDPVKRAVAGLVLVSPDWCWNDFYAVAQSWSSDLRGWVKRTLNAFSGCPLLTMEEEL